MIFTKSTYMRVLTIILNIVGTLLAIFIFYKAVVDSLAVVDYVLMGVVLIIGLWLDRMENKQP